MWEIRIETYRKQPEIVTVTALDADCGFSYSEENRPEKIVIESFVREAIARRDKWVSAREDSMETANTIVQCLFNALNKADGKEDVKLSVVSENGTVQCFKEIEVIKEI